MSGQVDENRQKKPRMANLELLRCVAMMMVVMLHFLGKGNLLGDLTARDMAPVGVVAWLLEAFSIVAVNVYMLISGYFLCESSFKLSRLIRLWLQVWFYSVGIGLLAVGLGLLTEVSFDTHYLLTLIFPISMGHYWFMTAYVFLYLLLPIVGMAARQMTKAQMKVVLGLLFFAFCILKSVLPLRLEMDGQGYDVLWYLCVFMAAAYIRRFEVPFLEKKRNAILLYVAACFLIFAVTFALRAVFLKTGSLELMLKMCYEYNHVLTFAASAGLFSCFIGLRIPEKIGGLVCKISPYTLGVFLLHENLGVRYAWQKWFGTDNIQTVAHLVLRALTAVVIVFVVGVIVDFIRDKMMKGLHRILFKCRGYRKVLNAIGRIDEIFRS